MLALSCADEHSPYFILEIHASHEEKKYLESIGVFPESLITVIKNRKSSSTPLILEVNDSQFMIDRSIVENIVISPALENQSVIFSGNKTKQRQLILDIVSKFSSHFSLKECVNAVQKKDNTIGEITVYRALKVLIEKNIIEEIELPDGSKKMEIIKGHHDHIFCKNCGNIIEFYCKKIEELQKHIAKEKGVTLISHTMALVASSCERCKN